MLGCPRRVTDGGFKPSPSGRGLGEGRALSLRRSSPLAAEERLPLPCKGESWGEGTLLQVSRRVHLTSATNKAAVGQADSPFRTDNPTSYTTRHRQREVTPHTPKKSVLIPTSFRRPPRSNPPPTRP